MSKIDYLGTPVFHITCVEHVRVSDVWIPQVALKEQGVSFLLYVAAGKATLSTSSSTNSLNEGDLWVLHSDQQVLYVQADRSGCTLYIIAFAQVYVHTDRGIWKVDDGIPLLNGKVDIRCPPVIHKYLTKIHHIWSGKTINKLKLQVVFMELWQYITLEHQTSKKRRKDTESIIQTMAQFFDEHYDEEHQIEELAYSSGMSPLDFYNQFKMHTSLSPLQYITKKRMDQARLLLTNSERKVNEIASEVGYKDSYYFSRMFKKNVGISPLIYRKTMQRKIVVLNTALAGNLIALGVPRENIYICQTNNKKNRNFMNFNVYDLDIHWLRKVDPDCIIGTDRDETMLDVFQSIAPTCLITYKSTTWQHHLLEIADFLNMKEIAKRYLQYYEKKVEISSKRIRSNIHNETVIVARYLKRGVRVFGSMRRKVGRLLYHELNLTSPRNVPPYFSDFQNLEDLNAYNSDHILLLGQPQNPSTDLGLSGKVYHANIYPWLYNSAIGQVQALDEAVHLFGVAGR